MEAAREQIARRRRRRAATTATPKRRRPQTHTGACPWTARQCNLCRVRCRQHRPGYQGAVATYTTAVTTRGLEHRAGWPKATDTGAPTANLGSAEEEPATCTTSRHIIAALW